MFRRMTSAAASAALTLTTAAVVLTPATAHAAPETYTGHVQVIVGDTIVGCVMPGVDWAYHGTNPSTAYAVSIPAGSQQDLTITSGPSAGLALGVSDASSTFPMSQSSMGYTFLTATSPVPAGSPSVANRQSAIWSVDPGTMHLSASYVWSDSTVQTVQPWQYDGGSYVGLSPNVSAVATTFPQITPATFRIGEACSGPVVYDTPQAITFTSAVPSPAYPGQNHTLAATGGSSGNAVTFTSATSEVCEVDGDSVSFTKPGTCTIDANQAAAAGYSAAPTVSQQITVSAIPSTVDLQLDKTSVVTGQSTTATADVDIATGSVNAAGGSVQFAIDGTDVGAPVDIDSDGRAVSPALQASAGLHQVTGTYTPADTTNYVGSTGDATLTVTAEITITSTVPSPAYPGQTYTIAATGEASADAVAFTSATADVCSVNDDRVSFTKPGTCTIDANQADAPTVSQQITVSAIPSTVDLQLDKTSVVTGQSTTATARVNVAAGSISAAGGTVQFAIDGTDVGTPIRIDSDGRATSPALQASAGLRQVSATYLPGHPTHYRGSTGGAALTVTPAITIISTVPSPAYPGQTYTIAATGEASAAAVIFTSATADVCRVDGNQVSFIKPGTCTIEANQADAPTVSQQITVSAIPSTVDLQLDKTSVVTGQNTTATAHVKVVAGTAGSAGGTVQFAVDGAKVGTPVSVGSDGRAISPALGAGLGSHQVSATYVPGNTVTYLGSTGHAALTVTAANTTTEVSVTASAISATVKPVAPGAGTPGGQVTFYVDGAKVGSAALQHGTAKLAHVVPADKTHAVSAAYAGGTGFNASSGSTSRTNPTVTARVSSTQKPRGGWYRTPVKVTFTCTAKGAELVTACPDPVTVRRQGASSVTRTIRTADGGIATATATVKLDTSAPRVAIKGVKAGRSYFDAPKPTCTARDGRSGVRTCRVTTKQRGSRVTVTAKAIDVAGNVRTKRVSYRLSPYTIQGAKNVNGVWRVRRGETYTILVRGAKPRYVYASPNKPHRGSVPFKAAGKNRWALGVTMSMATSYTRSWKLGYVQKGKLHTIRVRVVG